MGVPTLLPVILKIIIEHILTCCIPLLNTALCSYNDIKSFSAFTKCVGVIIRSMGRFPEFTSETVTLLEKFCAIGKFEVKSFTPDKIEIATEILKIHSKILSDEVIKKNKCFNGIAACHDLTQLIETTIKLSFDKEQPISFLATLPDPNFNHAINLLKHNAWKILNKIIEVSFNDDLEIIPTHSLCLSITNDIIIFSIELCQHYYSANNGIEISTDEKKILLDMITFLNGISSIKEFPVLCGPFKEKLILSLVFPSLRTTKEEYDEMIKDPNNFVNLASDTCEDHNSKIIKTEAAALLETLSEELDGCLTFVTDLCIDLINKSCNSTQLPIKTFDKSYFITKTPPLFIVDTSLVVLSILSYLICKRKDLM